MPYFKYVNKFLKLCKILNSAIIGKMLEYKLVKDIRLMIWYARQAFVYARHCGLESNRSSHQNRSLLRRKKSVCRFKNTSFIIVFCLNCVCQNDFLIQSKYQRRNSLHMLCSDIRRFNDSILTVTPTYPKSTSFTYFINHIFVLSYS